MRVARPLRWRQRMQSQEQGTEPKRRKTNGATRSTDADALDLREVLRALQSVRDGDFSVRLPGDKAGLAGKVADTFNEIVGSNERLARSSSPGASSARKAARAIAWRSTGAPAPGARWKAPSIR